MVSWWAVALRDGMECNILQLPLLQNLGAGAGLLPEIALLAESDSRSRVVRLASRQLLEKLDRGGDPNGLYICTKQHTMRATD